MQAQLHNATAYNADSEALKGQTLAVGSAKATVIQFATAGGYDGAVTVEISPDNGTTWFTLQAESLAALGTYVSSITSFTPAYRVIVPSQVQLRCRMSGGTAGTLTVTAVPSTFAARSAAPAGNPYALKVLGYSPTIFYRMNADTDTTVTDSSGNGLNGGYYGDLPTFGDGAFLDSSGTPTFTENTNTYADELISEGEFSWTGTWAQWVYIPSTSTTDYDQLMRFDHYTVDEGQSPDPNPCQLFLGKSSTTQLRLRINRGTQVDTFFSIALDEWMFIAVTMNNTEAKLYVNGDLLATITGYGTNNVALDFDWDWFVWGAVFTGNLANCAYWKDVILSASDIEDLADVPSVSEAFSPIFGAAPTLSTNTPVIGTVITITPGAWAGSPTLTYQWQRNTGSWVNISGATNSSYTPVDADFGYTLRVVETGTNGAGSASTQSSGTSNLTREAVTQTWSAELLTNGSLSAWTGGVPDGWNKVNDNGSTATITETARNGSAGTGAATHSNSGSAIFVNIRQTVYTVGDYYEISGEMTAYTGGRMDITFSGSGGFSLSAARAAQFLGRAIGTELVLQPGGALPRLFTSDDWGVRRLTPNAELTAPSANMDVATFYTVPNTPLQNHAVWLLGRVSSFSSGNYFLWLLEHNGTQWNVNLYAVSAHTRGSALVTVSNVGTTNGMRFYANGNTIRVYTTANGGGLWTQRGSDITNSTYNTAQGVNALLSSAFTLGQLTYVQAV